MRMEFQTLIKNLSKNNGYRYVAATSSDRSRVEEILTNTNAIEYFDDIICGDEVSKGKTDSEIFLTACKKIDI